MNPAEQVLRRVDRYQQQHAWIGVPFAVVKKFGDDKGGSLTTLLAYNGFFALLPLLLILVTLLGYLLGHHPTLEQQVLHSALAEFPILGTQLEQNVHALRANGLGLAIGIAGSLWGARGVTQAGQHAMAELWNIPGKNRPSFWTRQARGLALLLVFAVGLAATTLLTGLGSLGSHTAPFRLANLVLATAVNVALFLLAFRVLTPRQIPTRQLVVGSIVGGVAWQALLAVGGYLVGHNLKHASEVYGFFAVVLGLLSWLYLGAQLTLYAAEVNVVRTRHLWPRSLLQPPLTQPDERALVDLAKQEERRPEQSVEVTFTPEPESGQPNGTKHQGQAVNGCPSGSAPPHGALPHQPHAEPANVLVLELPGLEIVGTRIRVTGKTGMVARPHPGFLGCARMRARPTGPAQSSALHYSARSGPTKEAHRRAMNRSGGLLRSVAGRLTSANGPRPATTAPSPPEGPIKGGVEGPIKGGIKGPLEGPIQGAAAVSGHRAETVKNDARNCTRQ